jgi:thiol-disulfide isomerase/thioredoxin
MKNFFFVMLGMAALLFSFAVKAQTKSRISVETTSDIKIDSIFFSNISQDEIFLIVPFTNSILIESEKPFNDLYNLSFFSEGTMRMNQLWLNGTHISIKGNINKQQVLEIDTIMGSEIYYYTKDYREKFLEVNAKNDVKAMNEFLWNALNENLENPFSIEISNQLYIRNMSKTDELKKLYELLIHQDVSIVSKSFNPIESIEKVLFQTSIDFSNFEFFTLENQKEQFHPISGKKYLFDFWFVGCAPCIEDHKVLATKLDQFSNKNVEPIGISIDNSQEKWANYLRNSEYPWKNFRESDDYQKTLRNKFSIGIFPTYFIINDKGEIEFKSFSLKEVMAFLEIE